MEITRLVQPPLGSIDGKSSLELPREWRAWFCFNAQSSLALYCSNEFKQGMLSTFSEQGLNFQSSSPSPPLTDTHPLYTVKVVSPSYAWNQTEENEKKKKRNQQEKAQRSQVLTEFPTVLSCCPWWLSFFCLQEEGWEPDFHTCDALPLAGVGGRGKGCDDIRRYTWKHIFLSYLYVVNISDFPTMIESFLLNEILKNKHGSSI